MSQQVGYALATAAVEAMGSQESIAVNKIKASSELITLPRFKIPQELYIQSKNYLEKNKKPAKDKSDGLPIQYCAPVWMDMHEKQSKDDNVEVMVVRVGSLAFVGLPGEVFCELGRKIKRNSPAEHTIVIELANDSIGYLPTSEAFDQGGYEVTPGATMYERDAGEKIVASAIKQLNVLFNR